jgi:hypothetical protein
MSQSYRFIKISHNFPDHPKTVELSDRAFRLLVEAWCFSARTGCDGALTEAQARRLFPAKILTELLEIRYVDRTETGYQMHDYTDHQMTAAEAEERHAKRVAAGQRGGKAKAAASKPVANASPVATSMSDPSSSKALPEVEVEKEIELPTDVGSKNPASATPTKPDRFAAFWAVYPRKDDKIKAEAAYGRAVKRADPAVILAGARRYAADPNRDPAFTKHPTTWLNAGAWENEPLPPPPVDRRPGKPTADDKIANTLALGRQMQAAQNGRPVTASIHTYPLELTQ